MKEVSLIAVVLVFNIAFCILFAEGKNTPGLILKGLGDVISRIGIQILTVTMKRKKIQTRRLGYKSSPVILCWL